GEIYYLAAAMPVSVLNLVWSSASSPVGKIPQPGSQANRPQPGGEANTPSQALPFPPIESTAIMNFVEKDTVRNLRVHARSTVTIEGNRYRYEYLIEISSDFAPVILWT